MAFTSGTATDYNHLLSLLRTYLTAQGWTELSFTAGTVGAGGAKLFTRGPGAGAGRQTFVQISTEADAGSGYYAWRLRGSTDYVSGVLEGTMPGQLASPAYFNLWQNSLSYWFYVNDRRFIVVAKMGTSYSSMYAGFMLPWGTPASYPFPLYIGGTYASLSPHNLSNSAHRFFADPGGSLANCSAWLRQPEGIWLPILNHTDSSDNDRGHAGGRVASGFAWPYAIGESLYGTPAYYEAGVASIGQSVGGLLDNIIPTRQNENGLFPVSIHAALSPPFGVLDGVYCPFGNNFTSEQAVTIGARNFRLFQNIARSSGNDFLAVEEL